MSNFNSNDFKSGDIILFDKKKVHERLVLAEAVIKNHNYRAFIFEINKNGTCAIAIYKDTFIVYLEKDLFLGPLNVRF